MPPPSNQQQPPAQPQQPVSATPQPQPVPEQNGLYSGRLNRSGYLIVYGFLLLYYFLEIMVPVLIRVTGSSSGPAVNIVLILFGIVGFILTITLVLSAGIRRWHDLDQSGFFLFLLVIPFINFFVVLFMLLAPGTKGPNKYGPPITGQLGLKKILLGK